YSPSPPRRSSDLQRRRPSAAKGGRAMRRLVAPALLLLLVACDDEENLVPLDFFLNRMKRQAAYRDFDPGPGFPDVKVLQQPPPGSVPRERADRAQIGRAHV